jgi:hypothetical protein
MATKRQIEANRRNAQKSTGPRSDSGKKQSSKNSYKHGLSKQTSTSALDVKFKTLARKIAGSANDPDVLELARVAAKADIRLEEIRLLKIAIIESAERVGIDPTGPPQGEGQASEAIRNQLPNLVRFLRYETREAGRRDQAMRKLIRMTGLGRMQSGLVGAASKSPANPI